MKLIKFFIIPACLLYSVTCFANYLMGTGEIIDNSTKHTWYYSKTVNYLKVEAENNFIIINHMFSGNIYRFTFLYDPTLPSNYRSGYLIIAIENLGACFIFNTEIEAMKADNIVFYPSDQPMCGLKYTMSGSTDDGSFKLVITDAD